MNFKQIRQAAAARKPGNTVSKDSAYKAGKPDYMGGSGGNDVTSLDSSGNKQSLVNTPAHINTSGRGGTSKNY